MPTVATYSVANRSTSIIKDRLAAKRRDERDAGAYRSQGVPEVAADGPTMIRQMAQPPSNSLTNVEWIAPKRRAIGIYISKKGIHFVNHGGLDVERVAVGTTGADHDILVIKSVTSNEEGHPVLFGRILRFGGVALVRVLTDDYGWTVGAYPLTERGGHWVAFRDRSPS